MIETKEMKAAMKSNGWRKHGIGLMAKMAKAKAAS